MPIKPLNDRVVIRRLEESKESPGGIVLPSNEVKSSTQGVVVATGKGKTLGDGRVVKLSVEVGDKVLFKEGFDVESREVDGEDLLIMGEDNLLAVLLD